MPQAVWLGKLYNWKEKSNNVDLFNWGLAHYSSETVPSHRFCIFFIHYSFPNDIFGYYWRAQANAAIDTAMAGGIAIPYFNKVVEIGETNKGTHKKMLLKLMAIWQGMKLILQRTTRLQYNGFQKYLDIDPDNSDIKKYVEQLEKWIAEKK